MPFLTVYSNAELKGHNDVCFTECLSELVANKLNKPIGYVIVRLLRDKTMAFGSSAENKGVLAYLESIGFNDKQEVVELLSEFFREQFEKVELRHINIVTQSLSAADVAVGGRFLG